MFFAVFQTKNQCRNSFFGGMPVKVTHGGGHSTLLINTCIQLQSKNMKMPMNISAVSQGLSNADSPRCWTSRENDLSKLLCSLSWYPLRDSGDEFPSGRAEWHKCTLPFCEWSEMKPTFTKSLLGAEMDLPESLCFTLAEVNNLELSSFLRILPVSLVESPW